MFTKDVKMFLASVAAAVSLTGCGDWQGKIQPSSQEDTLATQKIGNGNFDLVAIQGATENGDSCVRLLAGQTQEAGQVCSRVEGENLKITYSTTGDWKLFETHMWIGTDLANMPQTKSGNPKIGNFRYQSGALNGVADFSFLVPLSNFGLVSTMEVCASISPYIVAHAVVKKLLPDGTLQSETGYGEGLRLVEKGNWATFFNITLNCVVVEEPEVTTETAFAFGNDFATCFIDSGLLQTERWGWFNGPLAAGRYEFPIYAAAGQCDLSKGYHVGNLVVNYDGSSVDVTYNMFSGFRLEETHLYVGGEPLPRDRRGNFTVAPGLFGHVHNLDAAASDSFRIGGLTGNIFVVAHAVVASAQWNR